MELPKKAVIVEVGPRDGFQNVKDFIATKDKVQIIKKLIDSGLKHIEATSFVHPKWVPQMADAKEVLQDIKVYAAEKDIEIIALVPNKVGALKAKAAGVDWITYVISASEAHNLKNVNRTIEQSFVELEDIINNMGPTRIRLAIATTFGCPFGEKVPVDRVISMAKRAVNLGAGRILLADTIGTANPLQVKKMVSSVKQQVDVDLLGVHLHDTRGMGLANTIMAATEGINYFESAAGGLGGCPFAPGAAGNIATEDLVNMLHSMSIETSINLDAVYEAVGLIRQKVHAPIVSHMSRVCRL